MGGRRGPSRLGLGLCDADPAAVLEVLRGCVVPGGAGRWLRPRAELTS
ncbi:hypothetical protein POL58_25210 [Nannocystis sp. ncelm1]|uniref:Uncharacterized protein n=1 Tax=Nannocystis radixulma TaxID=2995305 RepID=A0ABT5BBR6_9BACT|nr:hypothetical protein [Nannocystis radixulma]MDC0671080.1 hypothetical protein [Nannocystis radixulma]